MTFSKELDLLIKARYPILYISSLEEDRLEYTIRKTIKMSSNRAIYTWDFIEGYKTNINNPRFAAKNPLQALELVEKLTANTPAIFILKDFNKFLNDMPVSRKLRNLLSILKTQPKSLIILATETEIPKELADIITILEFNLPSSQEIKNELLRLGQSLDKEFNPEFLEILIRSCQGLSIEKIRRALSKSIAQYGAIDKESIDLVLREKRQIISQTQILEFQSTTIEFSDIGGLENLKLWLENRKESFSEKAKIVWITNTTWFTFSWNSGNGKVFNGKSDSE